MAISNEGTIKHEGRAVFAIILIAQLLLAIVANCGGRNDMLSGEAISRTGVAVDLLHGDVKGRQGLVGSLYWAPLPTLLLLPVIPVIASGFASCIVSAFVAAAAGTFLNSWWRRQGVSPRVRFGGVLLYEVQPQVIMSVIGGSSSIVFATLIFVSFACLVEWLRTARLSSLAYLSVFTGLALLTRYQAVLFALAVLLIIVISVLPERGKSGYREATLITFVIPPLYAAGVWFAANWLIMGDPLFFLRGVLPSCYVKASLYTLLTEGCPWDMALIPMLLVCAAWPRAGRGGREEASAPRHAGALILLICFVGIALGIVRFSRRDVAAERRERAGVVKYCLENHAEGRVVISGYEGYPLLRGLSFDQQKVFVHYMSMYLGKVLEQTRGKDLYILVPRPVGENRWEDVNLKFPGMYEGAPEIILFEHGWENWRLFRIVRTDM